MTTPSGRPSIDFYFVDVFAERPLTGNPLTLVPEADRLDVEQMKAVAREFNQSETTFLLRPTRDGARVRLRSFTPAGFEVDGAGHNALGAWLWLADTGRVGVGEFTQQIGAEVLTVETGRLADGSIRVTMNQSAPVFGPAVPDAGLASSLGITGQDLHPTRPAQVVSTGVPHLLVPVADHTVVDRLAPDSRALRELLHRSGGEGCYVYSLDSPDGVDAYARFFNPTVGIAEDPATGTAAGPLAAALVRDATVDGRTEVVIEQGRALGRPSRLTVLVSDDVIRLSGSGLVVGEGRLTL